MARLARAVIVSCMAVLLSAAMTSGAKAQFCANNAECAATLICNKTFFGLFGTCGLAHCNSDANCGVTARPTICILGVCQASCLQNANCPAGKICDRNTGRQVGVCTMDNTPTPGTGTPRAGEGQACGPQRFGGGVIKNVGCARGLLCQNRRCVRLAQ